jgi:hypothetical protein
MSISAARERLNEVKKKRTKSFITNLIIIALLNTGAAVTCVMFGMINVFFFLFFAFLPTILSLLWDKKPGRFASKTVGAFNISGCAPHLTAIISSGIPDSTSYTILQDAGNWITIYGFAVAGWCMVYFIPQITYLFLDFRSKFIAVKMQDFQEKLLAEWGEDVKK